MTTFTAARAAANHPVARYAGAGVLQCAWGVYNVTVEPVPADIYQMCRLPAGAVVLDGFIRFGDIDTNGTETMDLDVGWEANADEAADPDGFGNFGVQDGDAITGYLPEGGVRLPLHGVLATAGPKTFTAETIISVTCVDDPATFTAGYVTVVVYFVVP
jgi:hypothetical protein